MDVVGINQYIAVKYKEINVPWIGKSFRGDEEFNKVLNTADALRITKDKFFNQIKKISAGINVDEYLDNLNKFTKFLNSTRVVNKKKFIFGGDTVLYFDELAEAFGRQIDRMAELLAGSVGDRDLGDIYEADKYMNEILEIFSQLAETLEYKDYIDAVMLEGNSAINKVNGANKYITKEEIMKTGASVNGFISSYEKWRAKGGVQKDLAHSLKGSLSKVFQEEFVEKYERLHLEMLLSNFIESTGNVLKDSGKGFVNKFRSTSDISFNLDNISFNPNIEEGTLNISINGPTGISVKSYASATSSASIKSKTPIEVVYNFYEIYGASQDRQKINFYLTNALSSYGKNSEEHAAGKDYLMNLMLSRSLAGEMTKLDFASIFLLNGKFFSMYDIILAATEKNLFTLSIKELSLNESIAKGSVKNRYTSSPLRNKDVGKFYAFQKYERVKDKLNLVIDSQEYNSKKEKTIEQVNRMQEFYLNIFLKTPLTLSMDIQAAFNRLSKMSTYKGYFK